MKKILALILSLLMVLMTACSSSSDDKAISEEATESVTKVPSIEEQLGIKEENINYENLSDPALLGFVEDAVYSDLVHRLADEGYFVENVEAKYISKEYLEELDYNSKENVYFGYTLSDLEKQFEGTKYIFTLGDDGTTTVREFEDYDDTYEKALRNVAIGSGVILLCVTVSVATGGAAPAASVIFCASAKTGTAFALSSGVLSGAASGIITGIKTKDFDAALKTAAKEGSEAFMWGAIGGSLTGGALATGALHGATLNGLTMNEAAAIQRESNYPLDVIRQMHSVEEYQVYKDAGLTAKMVNGRTALVQDVDLNYVTKLGGKNVTNLERMTQGYAPIDPATGKAYQLHHIGQKADGTLAILKEAEHQGNPSVLNLIGKESEIDRQAFNEVRKAFWKSFAANASM